MSPKGFSTYLILVGRAQSNKKINEFGGFVVKDCTVEARNVGNSVMLDNSTDGVSCEATWNFTTTMKYLRGIINHI